MLIFDTQLNTVFYVFLRILNFTTQRGTWRFESELNTENAIVTQSSGTNVHSTGIVRRSNYRETQNLKITFFSGF